MDYSARRGASIGVLLGDSMAFRRRGALTLLSLLALVIILGTGQRYLAAPGLAHAQTIESFNTPKPAILYARDRSHPGIAIANPALGLNGYCVALQSSTTSSVGPFNGFSVSNGQILTTAKFDNATVPTNDDIYCVVVQSNANPPDDAGQTNRATMQVSWTYKDSNSPDVVLTASVSITLVTVTLQGFDGVVGGRALVCTVGWSSTILTGHKSNVAVTLPDQLDKVDLDDWVVTTPGVSKLGTFKQGNEWCVALFASATTLNIDVEIHFDAVYDLTTNADDTPQPRPNGGHIVQGIDIVDIIEVSYSELRHVNLGGQLVESQAANFNTIGARHTACIIPSMGIVIGGVPADILDPADIVFLGAQGEVQIPNVVNLAVFPNPAVGNPGHLPGVVEGTLCFSWTSTVAGEQAIYLTFTRSSGFFQGPRFVSWDSNGDGNPDAKGIPTGPTNGALVKKWNRIDKTEVTLGDLQFENIVTNGFAFAPVVFNVADGSYVFSGGAFRLTEWVTGSHRAPNGALVSGLLDGTILVAHIDGGCGQFANENNVRDKLGKVINGVSNNGRFDRTITPLGPANIAPWSQVGDFDPGEDSLHAAESIGDGPDDLFISITNDKNCNADSTIVVHIDAYYPTPFGSASPTLAHSEFVNVRLQFVVNQKSPQVAWVGQIVTITYGFAFSGTCGAANDVVHFLRQANAPGNFIPDANYTVIGNDEVTTILGSDCSASIRYESEQQGEIDIEAFIEGNSFTKIAYPIFYMAIEDVILTASGPTNVSTFGDVSANVRGYFVGANQSTRAAGKSPDGRELPAGRWVIPDDWDILRGDGDLRPGWSGSPSMPVTRVTFFMENEGIVNNYQAAIFNGAAGWFELDGSESSLNVNPYTGLPSILGTTFHPRILTDDTDTSGTATVDSYGDFNLGYQGCDVNVATGNPHCDVGDIVGQTRYYALADYPMFRGPLPPVKSNVAQTDWTWAGYKTVTIENTDAASQKYVVVRLRDRDGFCDAINTNNVLGIPIRFRIDAGGGKIIEAQGLPVKYDLDLEGVVAITYDTEDDQGNPMNIAIVRPIHSATGDECQAWIKISRSLPGTVNVEITIPASPVPPTGDVRITGMQCEGDETITVTNAGTKPVSLAGWALHGPQKAFGEIPHLGLVGVLVPGESKTFKGGPKASANGWIDNEDTILADSTGFIRLVWQNYVIGLGVCPSSPALPPTFTHLTPLPETLPPSGEGELQLSVNVEFGKMVSQSLVAGWNLIGGSASITPVKLAIAGSEAHLTTIYAWDAVKGEWKRYLVGQPEYLNTLTNLEPGVAYWVHARESFTLSIPE